MFCVAPMIGDVLVMVGVVPIGVEEIARLKLCGLALAALFAARTENA